MLAQLLLAVILLGALGFVIQLLRSYARQRREGRLQANTSMVKVGLVGAFANFMDTLGIGSFAIKTAFYKQFKLVDDRLLPGTLNGQCVLATAMQSLFFIGVVEVDPTTLLSMIAAAALGATLGARVVSGFDRQLIRLIMGIALLVVAALIFAGLLGLFPIGGDAMGLTGTKLVIGIVGNFIFGVLMTVGIGLYAPCMTLVYLLGMSPIAAFPIMMGSCAILSFFSAGTFMRQGAFDAKAVLAVAITGPLAVIAAATLVQSLDLDTLKWLVAVVVLYTSGSMFLSWRQGRQQAVPQTA